jgi:ABC-type glycerol-3-phosphate transport system permease component
MVMTAAFLACLPMILLYMFGQRWFVEGLVAGSVK